MPIEFFISYSHKDEQLREQLLAHLSVLRRQGIVSEWHDRRIGAGEDWRGAIDEHLNRAQIVLSLVSADFLASDYCFDLEMKRAIDRTERGEALVIPIILRACDWMSSPLGRYQALPSAAKPITSWPNRDEAWHDVARGLRAAAKGMMSRQPLDPQVGSGPVALIENSRQSSPRLLVLSYFRRALYVIRQLIGSAAMRWVAVSTLVMVLIAALMIGERSGLRSPKNVGDSATRVETEEPIRTRAPEEIELQSTNEVNDKSKAGVEHSIHVTYTTAKGASPIKNLMIRVGKNKDRAIYVQYSIEQNQLLLLNEAGTDYIKERCQPQLTSPAKTTISSPKEIHHNRGAVVCSKTIIVKKGDNWVATWVLRPSNQFIGRHEVTKLFRVVQDDADQTFVGQIGWWTVES